MDPRDLTITGLGLGKLPIAPGTWGTLLGVAIFLILPAGTSYPICLAGTIAVLLVVGIALCPWAERHYGRKDPGPFVLDEVAGYLVVLAWTTKPTILAAVAAFFLFRLFDIVKPPPARQLERLPAGWGVMLDDVMAGVFGWAVLFGLRAAAPALFA